MVTEPSETNTGQADLFQRDLDRRMQDPAFRHAYEEQTRRLEASAGDAVCSTPCDPDCDAVCHEDHVPGHKKQHWPYDCPAAERYSWGGSDFIAAAVKRLRGERDMARSLGELGKANARQLHAELDAATTRAETAERELAEMRERIGEEGTQWAAQYGNGDIVYAISETNARVKASADLAIVSVVKRVVGEWQAARP